jgi:Fe-S-cluster containining protein
MSRHLPLLREVDAWQAGARIRSPDVIPCRSGCAACCHGPFDISAADALLVRDAVAGLPVGERETVRARAADQIDRIRAAEPGFVAPYDVARLGEDRFDAVVEAFADEPCPALDDEGRCRIYDYRPMVCRMMGVPMRTAAGEVLENDCPIQGEFPAYRGLRPYPFDLEDWEKREATTKTSAARTLFGDPSRAGYETTVAGAIMLEAVT